MNSITETRKGRAKNAILLLYVMIVLEALQMINTVLLYGKFGPGAEYGDESTFTSFISDTVVLQMTGLLAFIYFLALIVSAVFFVRWMYACYQALESYGGSITFTRGEVGWAFFIPFLNLVRPYQVIEQFWEEFFRLLNFKGANKYSEDNRSNLVIWWGCWIVSRLIGSIGANVFTVLTQTGFILSMLSGAGSIISALAIIAVINKIISLGDEIVALDAIESIQSNREE